MGKNTKKLFGIPISDEVNSQLNARKEVLSKSDKSPNELMLLSNKGAWVRMSSGINVVPEEWQESYNYLSVPNTLESDRNKIISDLKKVGNLDAIENVLMGGTFRGKPPVSGSSTPQFFYRGGLNVDQKSLYDRGGSYDQSPEYGYRPMPGITGFKLKSKSAYGSLREAEVSIKVNSREQLNAIDKLYLRPGYDMLLEWGNSVYINKDKEISIEVNRRVLDRFLKGRSPQEIDEKIQSYKENTGYNYDAIVGKVINFDWSYNTDGSYDCTVKLITRGEIMESLSSNKHANRSNPLQKLSKDNLGSGPSDIDSKDTISLIINSLRWLKSSTIADLKKELKTDDKIYVIRKTLEGETSSDDGENDSEKSKNYHWFISLRDLLSCFNQLFIEKYSDGTPAVKFATDFNQATYVTNTLHISSDPGICGVPYSNNPNTLSYLWDNSPATPKDLYGSITPEVFQKAYKGVSKMHGDAYNKKSPLAIMVNLDHALDLQKSFLKEKKGNLSKQQALYTYVKKLLDDISSALGGINILDLHNDIEKNEWVVVDRNNFGPTEEKQPLPRIDIIGLKSSVTNFGLSSKISSAIATQLAIGATASGLKQRGVETLLKYNQQLINRYDFSPPAGTTMTIKDEENELDAIVKDIRNAYISYLAGNVYDKNEFSNLSIEYGLFISTVGAKIRRDKRTDNKPTFFPGLLPMDLNIDMDGVAGLKVGEAFTVNPSILPERYIDRIAFVITQIEHGVDGNNRWSTSLTCKMFNLPDTEVATEKEAREKQEAKDKRPKEKEVDTGKGGWLTPTNKPWSAAFISFAAKKGYSSFPGKTSHTKYAQALRSDSNWEILEAKKTKPKVGDIVLKPRAGNRINFADSKYSGFSHSDIVVAANGRNYTIIGGNVSNTVKKEERTANTGGYESPWVIVMRPKTAAVNIQAIVNACESEWRFWHLSESDRETQRRDRESSANIENSRGDALLTRLDSYWSEANTKWGGQITRDA